MLVSETAIFGGLELVVFHGHTTMPYPSPFFEESSKKKKKKNS
jgi:hypothetical protein